MSTPSPATTPPAVARNLRLGIDGLGIEGGVIGISFDHAGGISTNINVANKSTISVL
jgi:hypothetical protein